MDLKPDVHLGEWENRVDLCFLCFRETVAKFLSRPGFQISAHGSLRWAWRVEPALGAGDVGIS